MQKENNEEMIQDVLEPINNIKTTISQNDQVLWAHEAAASCYSQGVEKLKEKHEILNKEIVKIKKEMTEFDRQEKILSSCYETQLESIFLNQEALINQRLYRNHVKENIKSKDKEYKELIAKYSNDIQKSKEKLEKTNTIYQSLQKKKTELKKSKINCLNLMKEIDNIKRINTQKICIRKKLFNGDIVAFAKSWLTYKKYAESVKVLDKEKQVEREWMMKLVKVTEQLHKKQKENLYKREVTFSMPKLQYPENDVPKTTLGKPPNRGMPFPDIREMFRKQEQSFISATKQHGNEQNKLVQKLEYTGNKSKIRILENKTLNVAQNVRPVVTAQSKQQRSKAIEEKLKKAAQNIKNNISRQNSRRKLPASVSLKGSPCNSQRSYNAKHNQNISFSQESNISKRDEENNVETDAIQTSPNGVETNEVLNITNQHNMADVEIYASQESNRASQISKASSDHSQKDLFFVKQDTSKFFKAPQRLPNGGLKSSHEIQTSSSENLASRKNGSSLAEEIQKSSRTPSKENVGLIKNTKSGLGMPQEVQNSLRSTSTQDFGTMKNRSSVFGQFDHLPMKSSSQEIQKSLRSPLAENVGLVKNINNVIDQYGPISTQSSSQETQKSLRSPLTQNVGLTVNRSSVGQNGSSRKSENANLGETSHFFSSTGAKDRFSKIGAKESVGENTLYKGPQTSHTEKPQMEGGKPKDNLNGNGRKASNITFEVASDNFMNSMGMAFFSEPQFSQTLDTTNEFSYKSPEFDGNFTVGSLQPDESANFVMGFGSQGNFSSFPNQSNFFSFK